MPSKLNPEQVKEFVSSEWDNSIIPALKEYIKIPNLSPDFDPEVLTNGYQDKAIDLMVNWVNEQNVHGLKLEVLREAHRTPIIFIEVESTTASSVKSGTVLMYGHMDKQPPFTGWDEGLDPYKPVIKNYKDGSPALYGRGGADDGYAIFASITAIQALKKQNIPHGRIIVVIEASEESGSPDLMFYIDRLKDRIGHPNFIICLDSGAGDYEHLWLTTSLRGIVIGTLTVSLLKEGVHSGSGSGVVADSFRVARMLLSRLEDEQTGEIKLDALKVDIPEQRIQQTRATAQALGQLCFTEMPVHNGVAPVVNDMTELLLNKTWKPTLVVTGAAGIPPIEKGGNVLRPFTTLKLSIRLPPTLDVEKAKAAVKELLESNPPYGAQVTCTMGHAGSGWAAPDIKEWVNKALQEASHLYFGKECLFQGEGGSIPFMGQLGRAYPKAQFAIMGLLGPNSNAHGPNEFLHIPYGKKLTMCVSELLAQHADVVD
jgi:acetylornithine deacetylase/succinyl-diaminopimelate desuccinylase-like protein